jgi:hypothetical protein
MKLASAEENAEANYPPYSSVALSQNSVFFRVTSLFGAGDLRRIWMVMPVLPAEFTPLASDREMEKSFAETLFLWPGAAWSCLVFFSTNGVSTPAISS